MTDTTHAHDDQAVEVVGHEEATSALSGHMLFEGDDPDGPSVCGCGLDEPDDVFDANDLDATKRWHADHLATVVLTALATAGFLATEQEWGVRGGDADLPAGSIDMYGDEDTARRYRDDLGGTVVSRRVTAWRDER